MENEEYEITGYRFISRDFSENVKVGDLLGNSYIWDGDEQTDDELNGTCAFESREMVEEYAKYSKGWIVEIGGYNEGHGDLAGEILISDAEVIEVTPWRI